MSNYLIYAERKWNVPCFTTNPFLSMITTMKRQTTPLPCGNIAISSIGENMMLYLLLLIWGYLDMPTPTVTRTRVLALGTLSQSLPILRITINWYRTNLHKHHQHQEWSCWFYASYCAANRDTIRIIVWIAFKSNSFPLWLKEQKLWCPKTLLLRWAAARVATMKNEFQIFKIG